MIDWLAGWLTTWLIDYLIYLSLLSDTFSPSQGPKVCHNPGVLCILTCKCASRLSGVPIFQIVTSKMAPDLRCFVHFDLQMSFAPQPRANFPDRNIQRCFAHLDLQMSFATAAWQFPDRNIQYWSRAEVFCTFWLTNVLRATAACHFSCLCWTATSAPAALASLVFEHQTQRFATFLTFGAWVSSF